MPTEYIQEEVTIIGRITHDAESAATSKLSEGAITIESSRALSLGSRVPLVLDPTIKIKGSVKGVGGVGIYPGAIVALKGKNGGGGYFLATEVLSVSWHIGASFPLLAHILYRYPHLSPRLQLMESLTPSSIQHRPKIWPRCLLSAVHLHQIQTLHTALGVLYFNKSKFRNQMFSCSYASILRNIIFDSIFFYPYRLGPLWMLRTQKSKQGTLTFRQQTSSGHIL
jgi:hypothetical protein